MTPKERFLRSLLKRKSKERWIAWVLLTASSDVLKSITGEAMASPLFIGDGSYEAR